MYPSYLIMGVFSHSFIIFWLHSSCRLTYFPYFLYLLVNWSKLLLEANFKLSKTCYLWVTARSRELQVLDTSIKRVIVQINKCKKARARQFSLTFAVTYIWRRPKLTLLCYFFFSLKVVAPKWTKLESDEKNWLVRYFYKAVLLLILLVLQKQMQN